jgi:hypothetical protein
LSSVPLSCPASLVPVVSLSQSSLCCGSFPVCCGPFPDVSQWRAPVSPRVSTWSWCVSRRSGPKMSVDR